MSSTEQPDNQRPLTHRELSARGGHAAAATRTPDERRDVASNAGNAKSAGHDTAHYEAIGQQGAGAGKEKRGGAPSNPWGKRGKAGNKFQKISAAAERAATEAAQAARDAQRANTPPPDEETP